jgi:oligopeptide/dipeptide ABC transporter ATP-binding protein
MYAGQIVEEGPVERIFAAPRHPYTEGLLGSIPPIDRDVETLAAIEGTVPSPGALPPGCRFHPRCRHARTACEERVPPLLGFGEGQRAACIRHAGYRWDAA